MVKLALVGNPNSGKTTLFNRLTGSRQYVGNWSGVTVERYEGKYTFEGEDYHIVDLPGIYSLSPSTVEQKIAFDYIKDNPDDIILNIVDAGSLERNLYLTMQLLEIQSKMIIVLNMMDELEKSGYAFNIKHFEQHIGLPVVPITARTGKGIERLLKVISQMAKKPIRAKVPDYMHSASQEDINLDKTQQFGTLPSLRYKYIEMIYHHCFERHDHHGIDKCKRHWHIFRRPYPHKLWQSGYSRAITEKIDNIVTNKYLALPIFLLIMFSIFTITFGPLGTLSLDAVTYLFEAFGNAVAGWLTRANASEWAIELLVGGIIGGLGSLMSFVPQIALMFLLLSLLEDSGYMARAALISDKLFSKLGLGGKSFIPLIMGFGCSVPAVMACRALPDERERKLTMLVTPLMSCSARLPVYAVFASAFFKRHQPLIIFSLYLLGIVAAVLSALLFNKTILKGKSVPLMLEMPPYRIPTIRNLAINVWDKVKGFVLRAGIIIFIGSVIIWFLQAFDTSFSMVENPNNSIFSAIGRLIAPVFAPLGFGNWQSSVALLSGFGAKEAVVGTLGILFGIEGGAGSLTDALPNLFTPASAYAFLVFTLLYTPCVATVATLRRELNSIKWTLFSIAYQCALAWGVAFIAYNALKLIW